MQVRRGVMGLVGGLAGLSLHAIGEIWAQGILPPRAGLALAVAGAVFFGGLLAMAGPLRLARAAAGAGGVALAVAALVTTASLRFDDPAGLLDDPFAALAALVLATLPLPFWIAASGRGWGHYPTLFAESWSIVVRMGTAALFTGIVWALVFLSDALLTLVGIEVIGELVDEPAVAWVLTGAAFGLALGVVAELADYVSPFLLLRLLRLLLPVVLAVMVLFLAALALGGFARLDVGLSVAGTLLGMALAAAALVSAAVDGRDSAAAHGGLARLAHLLAALVVVPAALAAWAIWLRVDAAGWSPPRLAGAAVAAVALAYGGSYLAAAVAGPGWMARIRRANVAVALAVLLLAAMWLTPVLNPQRIAAASQLARYEGGRLPLSRLDLAAIDRWGRAGAAARARLSELAAAPGQEGLAAMLAGAPAPDDDPAPQRRALAEMLPVSPPGADAGALIAALEPWELRDWQAGCAARLPDGSPACVLVLADFWPEREGDEAVVLFLTDQGWLRSEARVQGETGAWQVRAVLTPEGGWPDGDAAAALMRALQAGPPALVPVAQNALRAGPMRLMIQP